MGLDFVVALVPLNPHKFHISPTIDCPGGPQVVRWFLSVFFPPSYFSGPCVLMPQRGSPYFYSSSNSSLLFLLGGRGCSAFLLNPESQADLCALRPQWWGSFSNIISLPMTDFAFYTVQGPRQKQVSWHLLRGKWFLPHVSTGSVLWESFLTHTSG